MNRSEVKVTITTHITNPPRLYEEVLVGSVHVDGGERYKVVAGLSGAHVDELCTKSRDTNDLDLFRFTQDVERFSSHEAYVSWYEKERYVWALIGDAGDIAALAWVGKKEIPNDAGIVRHEKDTLWVTGGFRSYRPYRGIGIMTPFMEAVLQEARNLFPGSVLWVETNVDNSAGRRVFEKVGFLPIGVREKNGRLLMVTS